MTEHKIIYVMTDCRVEQPAVITEEGDVRVSPATDDIEIVYIGGTYVLCSECGLLGPGEHGLAADWQAL